MNVKDHVVQEGDVYVRGDRMRRVIAIRDSAVAYSKGTESNGMCKLSTFKRWLRHSDVEQVKKLETSHDIDPMQYGGGDCCDGEHA